MVLNAKARITSHSPGHYVPSRSFESWEVCDVAPATLYIAFEKLKKINSGGKFVFHCSDCPPPLEGAAAPSAPLHPARLQYGVYWRCEVAHRSTLWGCFGWADRSMFWNTPFVLGSCLFLSLPVSPVHNVLPASTVRSPDGLHLCVAVCPPSPYSGTSLPPSRCQILSSSVTVFQQTSPMVSVFFLFLSSYLPGSNLCFQTVSPCTPEFKRGEPCSV